MANSVSGFEAIGKTHKHNALAVWKVIGPDFPSIAQMARDVLSIPAASVGVERTFSIARHQMRYNRNYSPKMFETIMMTRHGLNSRTLQENQEIEAEMLSAGLSGQPALDEYEETQAEAEAIIRLDEISDNEEEEDTTQEADGAHVDDDDDDEAPPTSRRRRTRSNSRLTVPV